MAKKKKKMTSGDLIKIKNLCTKMIDTFKAKLSKRLYTPAVNKFLKDNVPYKEGKVYEEITWHSRRKYKRFVIFDNNITFIRSREDKMSKHCWVVAWGWWLDANDTPAKWGSIPVWGIANAPELKLSSNQKHNPVPAELAKDNE